MNEQLNFAEKSVQVLTLEQLERSYHENMPDGQPVGGIYHFQLIREIMQIFENCNLVPMVTEIFAAANRDSKRPGVTVLPQLEERYGERAIEAHLLRRVYANIELHADATDELVTCLAVAYHQKGIQVGIGPMVRVCHNQTILGAKDVVANYGCFVDMKRNEKPTVKDILAKVDEWAFYYREQQVIRLEAIDRMKNAEFNREDMLRTIGILVEKRINHDSTSSYLHDRATYPLNSAQINEAVEAMMERLEIYHVTSYWDAYQDLNSVLKPDRMDIPQVLPQSLALYACLKEQLS